MTQQSSTLFQSPLSDEKHALEHLLHQHLATTFPVQVKDTQVLYQGLNAFRDAFNACFKNYDVILEDDWYKGEGITTIEYDLRCKDTKEFLVLAQDVYQSHQDAKGVWHLGDYQHTEWKLPEALSAQTLQDLAKLIEDFIDANTPLVFLAPILKSSPKAL